MPPEKTEITGQPTLESTIIPVTTMLVNASIAIATQNINGIDKKTV